VTIVSIARSAQTDANAFLKTLTNLGLNVDRRTDTTLHLEVFPNRPDLYSERTIRAAVRLYQKELIAPLPPIASRASCVSSEGPRQVLELYAPCVLSEQTQQDFEQLRSLLDRILGRQGKRFGISLIHLNDQRPIGAGVLHTETPLSRFYRFDAPDTAIRYEIGESTEWLADGTSVLCLIDGDNPKDLLRAATIIRRFLRDEQTTLYVNEPFASQMNDRFEFEYSHQSFEQSLGCVLDPSEIRELVRTDAQVNLVDGFQAAELHQNLLTHQQVFLACFGRAND